jgi:hypothetical protein
MFSEFVMPIARPVVRADPFFAPGQDRNFPLFGLQVR